MRNRLIGGNLQGPAPEGPSADQRGGQSNRRFDRLGAPIGTLAGQGPIGTENGAPKAAVAEATQGSGIEIAAAAAFGVDRRQAGGSNASEW